MAANFLDLTHLDWYRIATEKLSEIRKQESEESEMFESRKRFELILRQVRFEFRLGLPNFVRFIMANHPPKHSSSYRFILTLSIAEIVLSCFLLLRLG